MSDDEDYNSEEDVDYVPSEGEQVSEEENSGEEEDLSLLQDDDGDPMGKSPKKRSKVKKKNAIQARKRRGGIKLDEEANGKITDSSEAQEKSEEEIKRKKELAEQIAKEEEERRKEKEKKRADELWSSFMSDVKKPPVRPTVTSSGPSLGSLTTQIKTADSGSSKTAAVKPEAETGGKTGKVTITKVFDFAGEEIKVTKEVDANSKEAKAEQKKLEKDNQEKTDTPTEVVPSPSVGAGMKRPAVGGLGSVLNKINKKTKMGTLEKSKIDWESFKRKEGIEEDLKIHNKGKHGYTERMAFLNRADQRQYEIERDLRLGNSSKR